MMTSEETRQIIRQMHDGAIRQLSDQLRTSKAVRAKMMADPNLHPTLREMLEARQRADDKVRRWVDGLPTFDESRQQHPKPKLRLPGGGRKRSINDDQMDKGIKILCGNSKLKGKAALNKLRAAGIQAGDTTLYKIIRAARKFQK